MSYLLGKIIRSERVTEWERACLADTSLRFDSQYYNQQINKCLFAIPRFEVDAGP